MFDGSNWDVVVTEEKGMGDDKMSRLRCRRLLGLAVNGTAKHPPDGLSMREMIPTFLSSALSHRFQELPLIPLLEIRSFFQTHCTHPPSSAIAWSDSLWLGCPLGVRFWLRQSLKICVDFKFGFYASPGTI